jgi:hypothetical protein
LFTGLNNLLEFWVSRRLRSYIKNGVFTFVLVVSWVYVLNYLCDLCFWLSIGGWNLFNFSLCFSLGSFGNVACNWNLVHIFVKINWNFQVHVLIVILWVLLFFGWLGEQNIMKCLLLIVTLCFIILSLLAMQLQDRYGHWSRCRFIFNNLKTYEVALEIYLSTDFIRVCEWKAICVNLAFVVWEIDLFPLELVAEYLSLILI